MSPSVLWFFTRASGVVALLLLTASICLGIATTIRWRTRSLPRFAVNGLHRNATLLAIVFVVLHVATTVADGYAPIGWKDAFVPFASPYRPLWLGLGAVAFDLLLALVITSLLRARIGYRTWRAMHWLAYVSWPIALLHSLGTGSDARLGWMEAVGLGSVLAVAAMLAVRLAMSSAEWGLRVSAAAGAALAVLVIGAWYRSGPGATGWAAKAGTPATLLAHPAAQPQRAPVRFMSLQRAFTSHLVGRITESQTSNGLVDLRIDGRLTGDVQGRLRLVLQGVPLDDGGVNMTGSGVAFGARGTSVYEGNITALSGNSVSARLRSGSSTIDLQMQLHLAQHGSRVTAVVQGATV